jgi:hypothetical protein
MSRSVVCALHLWPLIAHARRSAGDQRLARGIAAGYPMPAGPHAEPGPVSHHLGPDFISRESEAGL